MIGSLGPPMKPRRALLTLNVQFLSVADISIIEQTVDMLVVVSEQLPQSEVI